MNEENIEELKRLFYTDTLTQYGKRKLINYYEKQIKELQKEDKEWQKAYQEEKDEQFKLIREKQELEEKWDKDTHKLQNTLDITNAKIIELSKDNEELRETNKKLYETGLEIARQQIIFNNYISVQKVKEIIERIDYDITKTKKIISGTRKNEYQIVRLKAMNTKSLDIKNRLQELIEEREEK